MNSKIYEKVTWEEDLWFREYVHELEFTKGFYQIKYFNNWIAKTEKLIVEIKEQTWDIEKFNNMIKY
jgi:hypothetical protein